MGILHGNFCVAAWRKEKEKIDREKHAGAISVSKDTKALDTES